MLHVLFTSIQKDEDVVEVDGAEPIEEGAEGVVHEVLEGCGGVCETERHDRVFEVAVTTAESGFPLIALCDPDQVVGAAKVEFGEELGAGESIEEFGDKGERVAVLDCDGVEASRSCCRCMERSSSDKSTDS